MKVPKCSLTLSFPEEKKEVHRVNRPTILSCQDVQTTEITTTEAAMPETMVIPETTPAVTRTGKRYG
jgi:hypothetical protein